MCRQGTIWRVRPTAALARNCSICVALLHPKYAAREECIFSRTEQIVGSTAARALRRRAKEVAIVFAVAPALIVDQLQVRFCGRHQSDTDDANRSLTVAILAGVESTVTGSFTLRARLQPMPFLSNSVAKYTSVRWSGLTLRRSASVHRLASEALVVMPPPSIAVVALDHPASTCH